ncbi:zinc ribbon domain-containing protein [Amycolatopsis sp. Hca4]|uniref:zinc ribbon domain-containing protein n=1 Tax=Amycolatopsis sp. Hca4 TaxID=2742131 RepID=UPI0020CB1CFE|nr:zinc ribbon domain-containing protein [Amycolatopsis sp. Hca4]
MVLAGVVVFAAVVATVAFTGATSGGAGGSASGGMPAGSTSTVIANPPETVYLTPPETTLAPSVIPSLSAEELLRQQVRSDHAAVEELVGWWVPQLSSKRVGLLVEGRRFGVEDVWSDFQGLKSKYPGALLLSSDDFVSFGKPGFWVTVERTTFASGEEANSWCEAQGIGPDDCYAKRLTHTGSPSGNTMLRR